MNCTWCGADDHEPFRHGGLGRRPDWFDQRYPFREPRDTWSKATTVEVTLNADELRRSTERARKVIKDDTGRGYQMVFDPVGGETRLEVNVRGFAAELAAAKVTGLPLNWEYLPNHYRRENKPADIGRRVEVRNALKNATLWARKSDPVGRVFLLVTGGPPTFRVSGWLEGIDLQQPENWRERSRAPGWAVGESDLNVLPLPEDA